MQTDRVIPTLQHTEYGGYTVIATSWKHRKQRVHRQRLQIENATRESAALYGLFRGISIVCSVHLEVGGDFSFRWMPGHGKRNEKKNNTKKKSHAVIPMVAKEHRRVN